MHIDVGMTNGGTEEPTAWVGVGIGDNCVGTPDKHCVFFITCTDPCAVDATSPGCTNYCEEVPEDDSCKCDETIFGHAQHDIAVTRWGWEVHLSEKVGGITMYNDVLVMSAGGNSLDHGQVVGAYMVVLVGS